MSMKRMKRVNKILSETDLNEAQIREQATYLSEQDEDLRDALSRVSEGTFKFTGRDDIDTLLDSLED